MRLPSSVIFGILGFACSALLGAQCPSVSRHCNDPTEGSRVAVDVFVTDSEGQPISGLEADDFELYEDGQPVSISTFLALEEGELRSNNPPRASRERLKIVFLIDQLHLSLEHKKVVLAELAEFVMTGLDDGDEAMVVSHDGAMAIEQRFTRDAARLARALENLSLPSKMRPTSSAFEQQQILRAIAEVDLSDSGTTELDDLMAEATRLLEEIDQYARRNATETFRTLDKLQGFFDTLAGISGRKAVIHVSDGLPRRPGEALYRAWGEKYSELAREPWRVRLGHSEHRATFDALWRRFRVSHDEDEDPSVNETESFNAAWASREVGRKASNSRITFYGLSSMGRPESDPRRSALLRNLADATGGLVTDSAWRFEEGLRRVGQDLTTYYGLSFLPRPSKKAMGERRLDVRLRHPENVSATLGRMADLEPSEIEIRHRTLYGARSRRQIMDDRTLASLVHETSENPLGVTIDLSTVHFDEQGHQRIPILVKIPVDNLVLLPVEDRYEGKVSIHVGARDPAGQTSPIESVEVDIHVPSHHLEESDGQARIFGHHLMLKMSPGDHLLAVGVFDAFGNTEATTLVRRVDERETVAREPQP